MLKAINRSGSGMLTVMAFDILRLHFCGSSSYHFRIGFVLRKKKKSMVAFIKIYIYLNYLIFILKS